jgi:hypothetical protein
VKAGLSGTASGASITANNTDTVYLLMHFAKVKE